RHAGQLPVVGVTELEPQPPIPHRLTSRNLIAAGARRPHRIRIAADLLSLQHRTVAPPPKTRAETRHLPQHAPRHRVMNCLAITCERLRNSSSSGHDSRTRGRGTTDRRSWG